MLRCKDTKNLKELLSVYKQESLTPSNVPEQKYRALMQAASKGSYFSHNIKEQYPTYKIR